MSNGQEVAKTLFQKIVGTKPTRVKQGHGSFITMDFGRDIQEQVKTRNGMVTKCFGEWHLWIYMCAWRIDKEQIPSVGFEDTREKIATFLLELQNRTLTNVNILNQAFDTRLVFGDMEVHLFSFHTTDQKQWMLFTPEKKVFVAGPKNSWSYNSSDAPLP